MSPRNPSLNLDPHSRSLTPAPDDGQQSPASRAPSPAGRIEDTTAMLAWRNARDTYRRSLPEKDFKRIMVPAGPDDVLKEIEKWQGGQSKSKCCRAADGIQVGISQLEQFNRAVDLIAQGSPAPGCLVWGSIIFVLTVSNFSFVIDENMLGLLIIFAVRRLSRRPLKNTASFVTNLRQNYILYTRGRV